MPFIDDETLQYPISYEQVIARFPLTSFPPGADFVAPAPFKEVVESPKPDFVYATQQVVEDDPVKVDGVWLQTWKVIDIFATQEERDASIAAAQAADDANLRQAAKSARAAVVEAIKVTTSAGNTFDGDEVSQGRMARGILGLQAASAESVLWVLADNTAIQVSAAELGEALALAGAAQAAAWVIP